MHFLSELAQRLEVDTNEVYILDFSTLQLKHNKVENNSYSKKLNKYARIKFSDRIMRPLLINKILKEYDFDKVNFQFLYWHYIFCVRTFVQVKAEIFITIFGSDFYRAGSIKKRFIYPYILKRVHSIIFTNNKTKQDFNQYYKNLKDVKKYVCRLGLPALSYIDKNREEKTKLNKHFSLPTQKIIVSVGYNLTKEQQHIKAIDAIELLEKEEKEKLHIVFPLTYGGSKEYLESIEKYLAKHATFSYTILTKYMDNNEISKLRIVTDIMINILETDQFSGSMQEHLYANNVVIAGTWLPYETMREKGIFMKGVKSIDTLHTILSEVLENLQEMIEKSRYNTKYISELSSWDNVISCWKDIFK